MFLLNKALLQSADHFYRTTLFVSSHTAKAEVNEICLSTGDNSQSISVISAGLHLKTLGGSSRMIDWTWLYIIMSLAIIYYFLFYLFNILVLFFLLILCCYAYGDDAHSMVQAIGLCLPSSCQASVQQNHFSSAVFWALWVASVLAVELTAPSQHRDTRWSRPFTASL